ncbi:hypothetical protein [Photorhabdus sp. SF281]|uniref:hypothetical protein n=1 Tax=Photorhabdus sp. SF281 TaxID=3459527 RepID=UPI004044BFB5
MKTVAIVDPYSSGQYLAGEFYSRVFSSICIIISANIPTVYVASYNKDNFIKGKEYVVDSVSLNKTHYITNTSLYKKQTLSSGAIVYSEELFIHPSEKEVKDVIEYAVNVMNALGIHFGAAHFDSRLALSIYSLIAIISVVVISFIGLKIEKKQEEKMKQQLQQEE